MTGTALKAGGLSASGTCSATIRAKRRPQSANNTHMIFANEEHEKCYYEKLEHARDQDCYHKALIYILGIKECREYSVSDIFCCSYATYFWQGIQLRYPGYCQKQRSTTEILAEMERKCGENSTDGNKGTNRYYQAFV